MTLSLTDRLSAGETILGTFVLEFPTTGIGRLAAGAGAEFIVFDAEHTGWTWETLGILVSTTRPTTAVPLIRVPGTHRTFVSRALDLGARGIMVPMVRSVAEASDIVDWAKYPPVGTRGAAFGVAHDDYGDNPPADTMATANRENIVIAQIETVEGLDAVEDIAAVDGIDVVWVGHFDLTNSMGIPGKFTHPDYFAALDRVSAAAKAAGKAAGFMPTSLAQAKDLIERGFRILAYNGDLWLYKQALAEGLSAIRGEL